MQGCVTRRQPSRESWRPCWQVILPFAKCYVDDILICSPDVDTHLSHLDIVLSRLHDVNMKGKAKKCHFGLSEIKYLGHIITQEGVKLDPENVAAIKDLKQPTNVTEVRAFLGTTGIYRRFMKGYAAIAKPLTDFTHNDVGSVPESWTPECTATFETLRQALMEEPVLTRPDWTSHSSSRLQTGNPTASLASYLKCQTTEWNRS